MNTTRLERIVHRLRRVSRQRWGLIAVSVVAAAAASSSTALAAGHQTTVVSALIVGLAIASVISPDTHVPMAVEVIVVWQWFASTDDPTNAWAIPMASCLFVFHIAIALMAVTPVTANLDRSILLRWSRRSGYVVVATIGMWALVVALHERRASGSGALTLAGFVALTGLIAATRALSAARESRP
jgi:hypothetical protein